MPVTDLTGTTWMFNDTVNLIPQRVWINFIDLNKKQFNGIDPSGVTMYYGFLDDNGVQDGLMAYSASGWLNPAYKTITITGGTDATNSALISWLESNATLQTPTTTRKSVDLTTLSGWSSLSDGSHNITIVAKADGYRDSEPSAAVSVEKAAEGFKVTFNEGDYSQPDYYSTDNGATWISCYEKFATGTQFIVMANQIKLKVQGDGNHGGTMWARNDSTGNDISELSISCSWNTSAESPNYILTENITVTASGFSD